MDRKKQLQYYLNLIKDNEILLLKSKDAYFKNHYSHSPLNAITNFSGSEGEAVIEKNGRITLFVDTRYHILSQKQAFSDISLYKMSLGETFLDAFKKVYKKDTILHLPYDINLVEYMKLSEYFDLRTYKLKKSFLKNDDYNKKASIYLIDKKINESEFLYKIEKLKNSSIEVDRTIIFNLDIIAYLTNLRSFQMKHSSLFKSILYLDYKNSNYILFLDKIPKKINIKGLNFQKLDEFAAFIQSQEDKIYIEYKDIALDKFLSIKKPCEIKKNQAPLIASIKSIGAIEAMKKASNKLDNAIFNFKNQLKEGLSELQLVEMFENELIKQKASTTSFKTILSINENTASIHYSSYDKEKLLKPESLLLLDCGAYYKDGFATDITRTFYFGVNPPILYKKIYTSVLKAFIMGFLSKEKEAKNLDKLIRDYLSQFNKEGFYFNHGLGHGIGTSCHQSPPCLSINSTDTINPYQTHSIEPGLYGKKGDLEFGVRIENCVYFDLNHKRFSLSNYPFEEILIDYSLLNKQEKDFIQNWQGSFYGNN